MEHLAVIVIAIALAVVSVVYALKDSQKPRRK